MNWQAAFGVTAGLLLLSGFFVASEFALVGSRRHRLERAVEEGRRGAKAALAGVRELSLMLAGAQLGITMCIVGLGMISEPAVHHLLEEPMSAAGLPAAAASAVSLAVALSVVTFLHVVVGEMAPKSWAIAHPETSAMLLSPPFRAFTWIFRWLLVVLNAMSNIVLRMLRVTPRDEIVHVRNREQIHHLVDESERLKLITTQDRGLLTRALDAPSQAVASLMVPLDQIVGVPAGSPPHEIIGTAASTGRTRLVVWEAGDGCCGTVHVRDALLVLDDGRDVTAQDLVTPMPELTLGTDLMSALDLLQQRRAQLGLVRDGTGDVRGLVSLDDLLTRILTEG